MKSIEDIEKMSLTELEAASRNAEVPEGLLQRIAGVMLATKIVDAERKSRRQHNSVGSARLLKRSAFAMLAAAAAIAAFVLIRKPSAPVDSFDDPMLAYAQIEHTFQYISDKMSGGLNLVREAGPIVEKPGQIINKINEK
ncbi:MAG: hypothetical protein IJQ93_09420 [Bacteroidales bacterium]|nr:hypothetical protein [Bacteroidales bacterium]